MKHERDNQPDPTFTLEFEDGVEVRCLRSNTFAFVHSEEPVADHLFFLEDNNPETPGGGKNAYRGQLTNFDAVIKFMKKNRFTIIKSEYESAADREIRLEWLQMREALKETQQAAAFALKDYVSERQQEHLEHMTGYILYLLETEGDVAL